MKIEPLGSQHDRAAFSCGVEILDGYLQRQAGQDVKKRVAAVFVLTPDGFEIAGFYSLSQYSVHLDSLPENISRRLPRYPLVPATLIGRLAVTEAHRGEGFGEHLLMDALHRSLVASTQVASAAVFVDAKDETARAFYCKYGFIHLPAFSNRLFLPMGTVAQLFR